MGWTPKQSKPSSDLIPRERTIHTTARHLAFAALGLLLFGCKGGTSTPIDPAALRALDYRNTCGACHGASGGGTPGIYPPLKGHLSQILASEGGRQYVLDVAVHGLKGPLTVKGSPYDAWMPKVGAATHETLARALTHSALTFGEVPEGFEAYTPEEVAAARAKEQSPMETWSKRPVINPRDKAAPLEAKPPEAMPPEAPAAKSP